MNVFVFKGKRNAYGFTPDRSGGNLPPANGPWTFAKELDLKPGQKRIALDVDAALKAIDADGYYITIAEIDLKEGLPKRPTAPR